MDVPLPSQKAAGRRKARDIRLPGIYAHLQSDPEGNVYGSSQDDAQEAAGKASGSSFGTEATHARSGSGTRSLLTVGRGRAYSLLWSTHEWPLRIGFPKGGLSIVVEGA